MKGLIHIYCGDGKGKTTAAVGLAIRCAGCDKKIRFVQFLKGSETGEIESFKKFDNIQVLRCDSGIKFSFQMNETERQQVFDTHTKNFKRAIADLDTCDLLVLDEMIATYNLELIDKKTVLEFLRNKPPHLEVVLTGREPADELLELADYVSDIKKVKHPFDRGIGARKGIEK